MVTNGESCEIRRISMSGGDGTTLIPNPGGSVGVGRVLVTKEAKRKGKRQEGKQEEKEQ